MSVKEEKVKGPAGMSFPGVTSQAAILSSLPRDPRLVPCIFHELGKGWESPQHPEAIPLLYPVGPEKPQPYPLRQALKKKSHGLSQKVGLWYSHPHSLTPSAPPGEPLLSDARLKHPHVGQNMVFS